MSKCISLLLLILLLFLNTGFSQPVNDSIPVRDKALIKEISGIIKKKSLFTDSLDWNQIDKESAVLSLGNDDSINHKTIFNFFTEKLRKAGDIHSFFMSGKCISSYKKHYKTSKPKASYLGNEIGMITVPGIMIFDRSKYKELKSFANDIRHQIKEVDTHHSVKGWIVDLRNNWGGNMWPMLAGLNALIKDGVAGYFVSNKGEIPWYNRNGHISYPHFRISKYKIKDLHSKIAVLIDSGTASSGEATAISFIGLPNVKVFGQPSAGYTTANQTFHLSDGSQLYLATLHDADRNHKAYLGKIIPDVIVSKNDSTDAALNVAKRWILQ